MRYIPNAFQIPNAVIDDFLDKISGNAFKCYGKIVRQTTGWGKEIDYIPISQFIKSCGIKDERTVSAALDELVAVGLIEKVEQRGRVTGYRLRLDRPSAADETTPKNCGYPKNGGTPKDCGYPKNGGTPKDCGYPPPKNGGTTTPKNCGSSKPNIKPTIQKPKYISAHGAPVPACESSEPENSAMPSAASDVAVADTGEADKPAKPAKQSAGKTPKRPGYAEQKAMLTEAGVADGLADDYLALRRERRSVLTQTALNGLIREAGRAGLSLPQVLSLCCERGWVGFAAEWLLRDLHTPPTAAGGRPANAINEPPVHPKGSGGVFLAKDIF